MTTALIDREIRIDRKTLPVAIQVNGVSKYYDGKKSAR